MKLAFAALVLLGAASATTLTPISRQVSFRDFAGTFTSAYRDTSCPRKVFHSGIKELGGNAIPHAAMKINNVACRDNGDMQLFPLTSGDRVSAAINKYSGTALQLVNTLVENARKTNQAYMGVSNVARICGKFTLAPGSIVIFVKSDKPFPPTTGLELAANRRVMVFVPNRPGNSIICPYTAKLRVRPSPRPTLKAIPPGKPPTTPAKRQTPEPTQTASPSPSPSPAAKNDDGSVCFPAHASIETKRGAVRMENLRVGDRVRVRNGAFSPVFMFTHRLHNVQHDFVRLTAVSGASIVLTRSHYLTVNGALRAAGSVSVGDELTLADGSRSAVASISVETSRGLYNPQTIEGSIIVDGVQASTYTSSIDPRTAHSLLAPLRAVYGWLGLATAALDGGADSIAPLLPSGAAVY